MAEPAPTVLLAVEQLRRRVPGGIGAYTRGLLMGLHQCRQDGDAAEVTLLASRARRPTGSGTGVADPLAALGFPLRTSRLPGPWLTRAWDRGWGRTPAAFDVVHSVSLAAPPVRRGRSRLVVMVHDVAWRRHPEATTGRGRRWHEAALGRARRRATALVTPSRFVAADLVALGVDPARITVVHSGADHLPEPDAEAADELLGRLGVEGPFLLSVGTLEPRKNVQRLAEAYGILRTSLEHPWPLVVVGPPGWGSGTATTRQVPGVLFAGSVEDGLLAELYRRARAFAYVPLTEGYGMPPLEAMRAGTPTVVAREVPSVHDLNEPEPAPARLVDPLDVDDIAAGLADVLLDDSVRADLTVRGAEHARARTWRAAARAHIALWRALT